MAVKMSSKTYDLYYGIQTSTPPTFYRTKKDAFKSAYDWMMAHPRTKAGVHINIPRSTKWPMGVQVGIYMARLGSRNSRMRPFAMYRDNLIYLIESDGSLTDVLRFEDSRGDYYLVA